MHASDSCPKPEVSSGAVSELASADALEVRRCCWSVLITSCHLRTSLFVCYSSPVAIALVMYVSVTCPKPGASPGAVSELASADALECIQALPWEYTDCFLADLAAGLPLQMRWEPDCFFALILWIEPCAD